MPKLSDKNLHVTNYLQEQAELEYQRLQTRQEKKITNVMIREKIFLENLECTLKDVTKKLVIPISGYAKKRYRRNTKRILNLVISDTHFHTLLNEQEVSSSYGPKEESRAIAAIISDCVNYKTQYRDNTELYVHLLGDLILGELHDAREGANLTDQFGAASYYLAQALLHLSRSFPKVTVFCTPGNHGRRKIRHDDRATHEKWDSYESMIYMSLKMMLGSIPNITFHIPKTPYYLFKAFNKQGYATHGDTVFNAGFPSSIIHTNKLRTQINEWNASSSKCDLFVVGHVHTGSMVHLPSGPVFLSNGCLIPPDPYAISKGHFSTKCGQWMFESVENFIVGDSRFIQVSLDDHKNAYLNEIIKPYYGFETKSPLV